MKKYKKIHIITGGAGFIGSNYLKYVTKKYKYDFFIVVDKLTYAGNLKNIENELELDNVFFAYGDICDKQFIEKIFEIADIDYVVNFAAESHVDRSINDSTPFIQTNIVGTQTLLDICKKHWYDNGKWKRGKKYLQISTDEVYGALDIDYNNGKINENGHKIYGDKLFSETDNINPHSPYSASKASADMLVKSYFDTYKMPINITRCSNNYGPNQHTEKLIPLTLTNIMNDINIPVYGKGKNIRDWIYVEDHCIAIDTVLRKGKIGEIYNIGGNNEKYNIDLVKELLNIYNTTHTSKSKSEIEFVADRLGHDLRYAIDSSKIKNELNWEPKTSFDKGIKKTMKYYEN